MIGLSLDPELDQLMDVDSGWVRTGKSSLNGADTQITTRHPIGTGDSTVTCTPYSDDHGGGGHHREVVMSTGVVVWCTPASCMASNSAWKTKTGQILPVSA